LNPFKVCRAILAALPVALLFLLFLRMLIGSLSAGVVKG
jgi:ABC-type maltose transport system permease subunit